MAKWYQAHQLSASDRAFVSTDYLTRQLIAYIGNKRRILGFLYRIFSRLAEKHRISRFADPFSGSGSVGRLARQMGMEVYANDWEEYARILNSAYLRIRPDELDTLFREQGGIHSALDQLNGLDGAPLSPFVSACYAPRETETADYRTERLFYTLENALFIDRTREQIEEWFPEGSLDEASGKARDLLLALLLYEAATHVNTSGVFKAYHKGFGGHGKDALSRILSPMQLEFPVLHDSPARSEVKSLSAADFLPTYTVDLCYLDPPYTIHQYGSNYHLLNTIALHDFPPVDNSVGPDGRLRSKGGIRSDWTKTRSDFCYARTAPSALKEVMNAVDSRYVVLSYNSEGVIGVEQLFDILAEFGRIEINSMDYITYRGGRQSIRRRTHNTEFQIVVERGSMWGRPALKEDLQNEMGHLLSAYQIQSLLQGSFSPRRLKDSFSDCAPDQPAADDNATASGSDSIVLSRNGNILLRTEYHHRFLDIPSIQDLTTLSGEELEELQARLRAAACFDRREELQILFDLLTESRETREQNRLQRRMLHVLKKFTHRKYMSEWQEEIEILEQFVAEKDGRMQILKSGIEELKVLARRRMEG